MRRSNGMYRQRVQRGVALFVGLVFLVVLSLVAMVAMRGTLMEMHMVNSVAAHERAFEVSESLRGIPVALFEEHTFNRGWPMAAMGGTVADASYGGFPQCGSKPVGSNGVSCNVLKATTIRPDDVTGLVNFYDIAFKDGEKPYDPSTWMGSTADVSIDVCSSGNCTSGGQARIWIRPDGTALSEGSGAAQAAGYRGEGNSAASGGGAMFFQILSEGRADSARAVTLSQYRQRISN